MIVAGIMSGTSLDGIDVAIVDIGRKIKVLAHGTTPYANGTRKRILKVSNAGCHTSQISRLNFELPRLYAKALAPHLKMHKVALIGCHGQTIYHEGESRFPNTLQIGDGSVLAELTGIPVVSNFRPRDIAAGGKGAPLVPYFDYLMFRHRTRFRVALNIGGIANVTILPPSAKPEQVIAFDTGPGNMVMDQLVAIYTKGRKTFDRGGRIAALGRVHERLLNDPFTARKPPKTAGREQYGAEFVKRFLGLSMEDALATAAALTAATIAQAIPPNTADLIAGGGGVQNKHLMSLLAHRLPDTRIYTTQDFGIHPDAKEAVAFAVLAHATWHRRPANIPSATGAGRGVILGSISY